MSNIIQQSVSDDMRVYAGIKPDLEEVKTSLTQKVSKGYNLNLETSAEDPFLEIASGGGSAGLHLTNQAGFTGPYIFGLGKDVDGTGMVLPNKANGKMISGEQRETVTDPSSYWMRVTQSSTQAPLLRLEQNVSDSAPVLQLIASSETATQHLLYVGNSQGEVGKIYSADGSLTWLKDIVIHDSNSSGGKLRIKQGVTTSSQSHVIGSSKGLEWYNYTGSANLWYPFGIKANSNTLEISGGANTGTVGTATLTPMIKVQNNKLGFFGATPVVKPTGVTVDATGIHAALVSLGLIGA